jgi:hypothetical protein
MKRVVTVTACMAMLCSTVMFQGCETYGGSAGLGAGTGALAGGIIGHQSGRALEGAAIGAAIGGLAGLVVHDVRVRQERTRQQAVETYGYVPEQGLRLEYERSEVLPPVAAPGTEIEATMQYTILGAPGGIQVSESRSLMRGDRVLHELSVKTATREDGTWVSAQPFRLPRDLSPGIYSVHTRVTAGAGSISSRADFTVQ